jgi:hypothetical protein
MAKRKKESPYSLISEKEVKAFKKGFTDHKEGLPLNWTPPGLDDCEKFAYVNGWCKFGLIASSLEEITDEEIRAIIYDPSGCGK